MSKFPTNEDQEGEVTSEKELKIDEGPPDFSYTDEMRELRVESQVQKLNQRIVLLSILFPFLFGAILLFIYLDFNDRVNKIMVTKGRQVDALSEDVGDKIESVSQQYKELQQSLSNSIAALEKSNDSIQKDLKRNQLKIKKLTKSKADQKAMEQAIDKETAQTAKTMEALRRELKGQKQAVENLNVTLEKKLVEIGQIIARLQEVRKKQDSSIKGLSERKLDKQDFDSIIKDYQGKISLLHNEIRPLRDEITSMKDKVSRLQGQLNKAMAGSSPKPEAARFKGEPGGATAKDEPLPTPGKIMEQEIKE